MSYYKTDAAGNRIPAQEGGKLNLVEDITAAKTLTISDSGKVFILKAAAGVAISLPAVASGLEYEFITGLLFATTNFTIVSTTNAIQGGALVAGSFVPAANENTISFVSTADTLGDKVSIKSDGTNWYVEGVSKTAGSITFTVV